jgi:hypothetical protein
VQGYGHSSARLGNHRPNRRPDDAGVGNDPGVSNSSIAGFRI